MTPQSQNINKVSTGKSCGVIPPVEACFIMEEIWKDIPGYEGHYQASTMGRIKSLDRLIRIRPNKHCTNGRGHTVNGKILNGKINKSTGYRYYNLSGKDIKGSQLVAMAFLNHTPNGFKIVVDHINNISHDDRLSNLQLVSNRYNASKDKIGYTSKYVGVSWSNKRQKWCAGAYINGKSINLGRFKNEFDAHLAYQKKIMNNAFEL